MRIVETKIFKFNELSEEIQQKVLQKMSDINVDYDWWDSVYEDAENIGFQILAFDLDRASYVLGKWLEDAEDVAHKIIAEHGEHCEIVKTAKDYLVTLKVKKDKVLKEFSNKECLEDFLEYFLDTKDIDEEFKKSLCEDYKIMLQKQYDWLLSDEAIKETILSNRYEFTENGKLFQG